MEGQGLVVLGTEILVLAVVIIESDTEEEKFRETERE